MAQKKKTEKAALRRSQPKKTTAASRAAQPQKKPAVDRIDQAHKKNMALTFGAAGLAAAGLGAFKLVSGRLEAKKEAAARAKAEAAEKKLQAKRQARARKLSAGKRALLLFLGACCLAVFCFSGYKVVSELWQSRKEAQAFEDLTSFFGPDYTPVYPSSTDPASSGSGDPGASSTSPGSASVPPDQSGQSSDPGQSGEPVVYRFSKYDALYEQNNDLFGWIAIDGTVINYPVMYTPKNPEYYLRRGFDKKSARAGTPFLSGNCYVGCGNYIVYGHRMNNGSMFRVLLDYEKKSFWQAHPIIHFDMVSEPGDYQIIAAFYSRVYAVNETNVFRYYNYTDLTDEATFNEYITQVYAAALYDTGITAEYGDQLLTLSTCSYHVDNGRFVVVAKRIEK